MIIDGHHRYVCSLLANRVIDRINYPKTSATKSFEWNDVQFVNEEWDTIDKIIYLNELDAEYNNLTLEKINNIIT